MTNGDTEALGLASRLFGTIRYAPPAWLGERDRRSAMARRGLGAAVVIAALVAGYLLTRPAPANVTVAVETPSVTPIIDDEPVPQPLSLRFSPDGVDGVSSAAPLGAIGRPLGEEATLVPPLAGHWQWQDDSVLSFQPDADWPAGRKFRVRFSAAALADQVRLPDAPIVFKTPAFTAGIDSIRFHQDPVNSQDRRVVATVSLSHAIGPDEARRRIAVTLRAPDADVSTPARKLPVDVTLDRHGRIAYVRSDIVPLPPAETFARLVVGGDMRPVAGDGRLGDDVGADVLVPDRDSWYRVEGVDSLMARDGDEQPHQTLIVRFTDRADTRAMSSAVTAWLLPSDHRIGDTLHRGYRWRSAAEVTPEVLARAESVALTANGHSEPAAAMQSFRYRAPEGRSMLVRIDAGLASTGGYKLAATHEEIARVPAWPREVRIARDGGLLPLSGNRRLDVQARGLGALRIDIGRLIDDRISHLVSQTGGDLTNPWFKNHTFGERDITTRTTRVIDLATSDPAQLAYATVDLSEQTGGGGFYFVTVRGWDRANNRPVGGQDSRFVLVTDLGLLAKTTADGRQRVFVHGIAANAPVAGARVALLGRNGLPVFEGVTDSDGHVALPSTRGLESQHEPVAFLVRSGDDAAFMPYQRNGRRLDYSRFDTGGAHDAPGSSRARLLAHVFTDRGLYRPGQTARIGTIVQRGDWAPLTGLPVELAVRDARGQVVVERTARLEADGLVDFAIAIEAGAPTGQWAATVFRPRSSGAARITLGSVSFNVAEFEPDRTRIRAALDDASQSLWIAPGDVQALVTLRNLFGTAASGRRVAARARLVPATITPPGYEDYTFVDPFQRPGRTPKPVDIAVADATSDSGGVARLSIPVGAYDEGIYRLSVDVDGFEPGGGRSVSAAAAALVSPLDVIVGLRTDGDPGFIPRDNPRSVTFAAVGRKGQAAALTHTRVIIAEETDVSSLVQHPDGTYSYESVTREITVAESVLPIEPQGTNYALPTGTPGRFVARLVDRDGTMLARLAFRVAGARNVAGHLDGDARLDLALDRASYAPGDTITLQLTSPYPGLGLLSIESDRVHRFKWFDADTTSSVQSIEIPRDIEGNAYVNVALIRDPGSSEVFVSPLSYAVAPFRVDAGTRRLAIDLSAPQTMRPGAALTVDYRTDRPARLLLFAVDEGILQAAGYTDPDPLALFLRKQALGVTTHQILDLVIPDLDLAPDSSAPGGGDAMKRIGRNLNPFQRGERPPVAFWSGVLDAGTDVRQARFEVPEDFNGSLRILAVGAGGGGAGLARVDTLVRGPFVILPSLPRAVAPGDEFVVNVGLANNLEQLDAPIDLSVRPSAGLSLAGPVTQSVTVPAGGEGQTGFRLRAGDTPGPATLAFTATAGGETARLTMHTSVRPASPHATTVVAGRATQPSDDVMLNRDLYAELSTQRVAASASPIVLASGLQDYLRQFPHQCAEQMVSRVFPQIGLARTHPRLVDEVRLGRDVDALIGKLRTRQNPDGGFAFWPGASESSDLPSVYILHFLTDAKELGLAVPPRMLARGQRYLETLAAMPAGSLAAARARGYAIYVMTRNGKVTTSYLTRLHEALERDHARAWRGDLAAAWLAASYKLLKDTDLSAELIGGYRPGAGDDNDLDDHVTRDAQYLYLAARHFPDRAAAIGNTLAGRLAAAVFEGRFNTLSSAYTILALGEYSRGQPVFGAESRLSAIGPGGARTPLEADGTLLSFATLPPGSAGVHIEGSRPLYYSVSQSGFDRAGGEHAVRKGIEIQRDYLDDRGEPVTSAQLGDELQVRLRARSLSGELTNVAIVDLLPGGFEILPGDTAAGRLPYWIDYAEPREDRLVAYGRLGERVSELTFRVKATTVGTFAVPAAQASDMYRRDVLGRTAAGAFAVDAPQ